MMIKKRIGVLLLAVMLIQALPLVSRASSAWSEAAAAAPYASDGVTAAPYSVDEVAAAPYSSEEVAAAPYSSDEVTAAPYAYETVYVRRADGSVAESFEPGGVLETVVLSKRSAEALDGRLIVAVFDTEGVLENVHMQKVAFSAEDTGRQEVPIGLSLSEDIRNRTVRFFLWQGDTLSPVTDGLGWTGEDNWRILYNETEVNFDVPAFYSAGGEFYVCAQNLLNCLGLAVETDGQGYKAERLGDGASISYCAGESRVRINDTEKQLDAPIFRYEDIVTMLPFSVVSEAFGCTAQVNDLNKTISISYKDPTPPKYPLPSADGISVSYTKGPYYASFVLTLPKNDPEATVEVWYKDAVGPGVRASYWQRCANARYNSEDGKFYGGFYCISKSRKYAVRYRITRNGIAKRFDSSVSSGTVTEPTNYRDALYDTGGELLLVPTYENMSYYLDYDETIAEALANGGRGRVQYRAQEETQWSEAFEPYIDARGNQLRGSIVRLQSDTAYTVRADIYDAAGTLLVSKEALASTWNESPPVGRTIPLSELYSGSGALMLSGIKGTADGWVKITDDGSHVIDGSETYQEAVVVNQCEYVMIEGLTVRGGARYGVSVTGDCHNVRIANCDIAGWGRAGIKDKEHGYYISGGEAVNYDAGIMMKQARNITIERCYIHDSRAYTNAWNGDTWKSSHPKGSCGIMYRVDSGCVIRYNDIIGTELHRWNDGIEGDGNSSLTGGAAKDTDIYGNMFAYGQDDGTELDGGQMNARMYQNRIEKFYCGVSTVSNRIGPSYLFDNLITNLGCSYHNDMGRALKLGDIDKNTDDVGQHYLFGNTLDVQGVVAQEVTGGFHAVTRNNIFVNRSRGSGYRNANADKQRDDNDYDLLYGGNNTGYLTGGHSIVNRGLPEYENRERGIFRIAKGSVASAAGSRLNNFNETEASDLGAVRGENTLMPRRPVDMSADAYALTLSPGESARVEIRFGNIPTAQPYRICHSEELDWLSVSQYEGTAQPNSRVMLTLTADAAEEPHGGVVLVRLSDGYSIPIIIEKQSAQQRVRA